jgi:hypothetical protein
MTQLVLTILWRYPKPKMERSIQLNLWHQSKKNVVLAVIHTIKKFLKNDKAYVPICATIMGYGGTGKSYIINMILTIIRNMTGSNLFAYFV